MPNETTIGFMGGRGEYPAYATNYTALNYSETLRLVYDPEKLSYEKVIETYWHFAPDPTQPPFDPAYDLRIFVHNAKERAIVEASIVEQRKRLNATIYVAVLNASDYEFWKAGEQHQQFFYKQGERCGSSGANFLPSGEPSRP